MKKTNIIIGSWLISIFAFPILAANAGSIITDNYKLVAPKSWKIIQKRELGNDIPANISLALRVNKNDQKFVANINITKNELKDKISSLEYGKNILAIQKTTLLNFKEKDRKKISTMIANKKEETILTRFTAQRTETDPLVTFIQAYYVKDQTGYIITAALSSHKNFTLQKQAERIVRSFHFIDSKSNKQT